MLSGKRQARPIRAAIVVLGLIAGLASFPAVAAAATTCVGISGPGCEASAPTLQAALDAAKASSADDRVILGAGRFEGPFNYEPFTNAGKLEIVGQGEETILTAPSETSAITVLDLHQDPAGDAADVSDLSIHVPANTKSGNPGNIGIDAAGEVRQVSVDYDANDAPANEPVGVVLSASGAVLRESEIDMPATNGFDTGVLVGGSGRAVLPMVVDSRIHATFGVSAGPEGVRVVRSRIVTNRVGVEACNASPVTVEDSLIRVTESGSGIEVRGDNRCSVAQAALTARQVTIVGSGIAAGQTGVRVAVGVAGQNPVADVSLSIIRDVQFAFVAQTATAGTATVLVGASDFEAARHTETSGGGGTASFQQTEPNIDADPLFANELGGDFSLQAGSPAIDSAFSPPLAPGESATDLDGNPRIVDGNGDGVAARDMGALEAPAVAVPVKKDTTPPQTTIERGPKGKVAVKGKRRAKVSLSFSSSEPGSSFECKLDKGAFAACSSPFKARLKPGRHLFQVRATDAAGNVDPTPATKKITVARVKARTRR